MKKIVILTWLHNGNYGSILQAYALQKYLRNEGYAVNNIDLNPSIFEKVKNCIQQGNPLISLLKEKLNAAKSKKSCPNVHAFALKEDKFQNFIKDNFSLTRKYRRFSELNDLIGKYDAYICGSDQVWSPMLLSPSYYLDFLPVSTKKISYACSFGMSLIPKQKKGRIGKWLEQFYAISVRENAGVDIVRSLTNKKCTTTVDPTMLLSSSDWSLIVDENSIVKERYLLCYFLSYHSGQWQKAVSIAKMRNLKVVVIPTTKESYGYGDQVLCDVGPEDWINLIKNAEFVATDSFHGCVFSILYHRQFCVFKRFADGSKLSQNSRVYSLLSTYGLESCLVENIEDFQPMLIESTTYEKVDITLLKKVEESKKWILNAIEL